MNRCDAPIRDRSLSHGVTLVELLISLALLSIVLVGLTSWLGLSGRMTRSISDRARFEAAAGALLERINEDLLTGDFDLEDKKEDRVMVGYDALRIMTRSKDARNAGLQIVREYRFDSQTGELLLDRGRSGESSVLLSDLVSVDFTLTERSNEVFLEVVLVSSFGHSLSRRFRVP